MTGAVHAEWTKLRTVAGGRLAAARPRIAAPVALSAVGRPAPAARAGRRLPSGPDQAT